MGVGGYVTCQPVQIIFLVLGDACEAQALIDRIEMIRLMRDFVRVGIKT
jgi:hypothetical protein